MNDGHTKKIPAVEMRGVTKRFGFSSALKGIDLHLEQGEFLAIFGPNGAGKTTLLRILATLTAPSSGTIKVLGYDPSHEGNAIRQRIGVLSHQPFLVPTLTGYENLKFYGQMFGIEDRKSRIAALLKEVGMDEYRDRIVATFSRGMTQRIGIARALLHSPRLLLLDEPFTGLDQEGIAYLKRTLTSFLKEGNTILMACHDFDRGLELCTKTAILKKGELVYYGEAPAQKAEFELLYRQPIYQP